nr:putative coat protein duplicate [Grapevine leafroll-associated virus 10]
METVICLSKVKHEVPVPEEQVFFLVNSGVYAGVLPSEHLSFFYDKLNTGDNKDRRTYPELFKFLDNLGNVVATNNGNFMKFLDAVTIKEYFKRRYPSTVHIDNSSKVSGGDYCCLTVPALATFLSGVVHHLEGLTKVLAVGFTRSCDSEELWVFKNSFVVFENAGKLDVFCGDNMNTSNSAVLEVFNSFRAASSATDMERVINLLSI